MPLQTARRDECSSQIQLIPFLLLLGLLSLPVIKQLFEDITRSYFFLAGMSLAEFVALALGIKSQNSFCKGAEGKQSLGTLVTPLCSGQSLQGPPAPPPEDHGHRRVRLGPPVGQDQQLGRDSGLLREAEMSFQGSAAGSCPRRNQRQVFCAGCGAPSSSWGGGGKSPWMETSNRLNIHVSAGKLQQAHVTNCYPNCLHS